MKDWVLHPSSFISHPSSLISLGIVQLDLPVGDLAQRGHNLLVIGRHKGPSALEKLLGVMLTILELTAG